MASEVSKQWTYVSPKTNKAYQVTYGNFQTAFVYEFEDGHDIEEVTSLYDSSEARCKARWGNAPLAFTHEDSTLKFWGFEGDREGFVKNIVRVPFDDLPCCPAKGVESNFGSEFGPGWETKGLRFHRSLESQIRRALSRVFEFSRKSKYQIRTFHSYAWRPIREATSTRKEVLSNHCLGVALDINAAQNWITDRVWDMPKQIVQIMMEEGFFWGGNYHGGRQDPMHFEYRRPNFPSRGAIAIPFSFPFAGVQAESPVKSYWNTESPATGVGGYYGLGLHRNVHGGVHVFPPLPNPTTVHAMAPGYVAAVRLPRASDKEVSEEVVGRLKNWTGFVLLHHDVQLRTNLDAEFDPKQDRAFYSLYMHLAPLPGEELDREPYGGFTARDGFFDMLPWEGSVPHLYRDSAKEGNITCGVGCKLESVTQAQLLGFWNTTAGRQATPAEIATAWALVSAKSPALKAESYVLQPNIALPSEEIRKLFDQRFESFFKEAHGIYPDFDSYPRAARRGLLDMLYQLGAPQLKSKFAAFNDAVKKRLWKTAAQEALQGPNPERTVWRKALFEYAQTVEAEKAAPTPVAAAQEGGRP